MGKRKKKPVLPDQAARDAAITERQRNVVIEAGAGTGKTYTLVQRLLHLVAPPDGEKPIPLSRIAAITFTRRAAGELKLRLRQAILSELADKKSAHPEELLRLTLENMDTAYVGTIHSFCDRLLRLRPVEAELSPMYQLFEDQDELLEVAFQRMVTDARKLCMKDGLPKDFLSRWKLDTKCLREAEDTIVSLQASGLPLHDMGQGFSKVPGLRTIFDNMIGRRDVDPSIPAKALKKPELGELKPLVQTVLDAVDNVTHPDDLPDPANRDIAGGVRQALEPLGRAMAAPDVAELFNCFMEAVRAVPDNLKQPKPTDTHHFLVYHAFVPGKWQKPAHTDVANAIAKLEELVCPWLLSSAMRLFPVVCAYYETVKREKEGIDQTDLLLQVQRALNESDEARRCWCGLFDHILVDEFQDTDPVQMEIIFRLTADSDDAKGSWLELVPRAGSLTVVGDPKQSIYRFRRADISTYAEVVGLLEKHGAITEQLVTNFRSTIKLVDVFNECFEAYLSPVKNGIRFSDDMKHALYEPLKPKPDVEEGHSLKRLMIRVSDTKADSCRAAEASAWARSIRSIVEKGKTQIRDPLTNEHRPAGYGDIAILAVVTTNIPMLMKEFDLYGVPYVASGGKLFAGDETVRQLIFLLRAVADKDDGAAMAAVLRPPFFALGMKELVAGLVLKDKCSTKEKADRARYEDAKNWLRDVCSSVQLHGLPALVTALRQRAAFLRCIAVGSGSSARICRIEEMALLCEQYVHANGVGLLEAAHHFGTWIDDAEQVNIPDPQGDEVHVMSIHQSKGLEWPIVGLWDSAAGKDDKKAFKDSYFASRDGKTVCLKLRIGKRSYFGGTADGKFSLIADPEKTPNDPAVLLQNEEKEHSAAERKRLVYVAGTRARDILIVPVVEGKPALWESVFSVDGDSIEEEARKDIEPFPVDRKLVADKAGDARRTASAVSWRGRFKDSIRPYLVPMGAAAFAKGDTARMLSSETDDDLETGNISQYSEEYGAEAIPVKFRHNSRHGAAFGSTVHASIGSRLNGDTAGTKVLVERHAASEGLAGLRKEAAADTRRALETLNNEGILGNGKRVFVEFPITGASDALGNAAPDALVKGYIDLLVVGESDAFIIDFKTDQPPAGSEEPDSEYIAQVNCYIKMIKACSPGFNVQGALLYTADGSLHRV